MRAVTSATAAAVLGMDRRALDSMLSRLGDEFLPAGRQGVDRRIPVNLLEVLALTADLARSMGIPTREAFFLARSAIADPGAAVGPASGRGLEVKPERQEDGAEATVAVGEFTSLRVDRQALRGEIEHRLAVAIESVVRPRRGRPKNRESY